MLNFQLFFLLFTINFLLLFFYKEDIFFEGRDRLHDWFAAK
jgi:hypothetical protein